MITPYHIILVPHKDQMNLLEEGGCGSRPPMFAQLLCGLPDDPPWDWRPCDSEFYFDRWNARIKQHADPLYGRALVLAFGGAVLRSGVNHLPGITAVYSQVAVQNVLTDSSRAAFLCEMLKEGLRGFGTVIFLDRDRKVIKVLTDGPDERPSSQGEKSDV